VTSFQADVKPLIADIPGWLTDEEGEALFELARQCRGDGVIVEIGSWKGKSTVCLGLGSQAGSATPIYAVDPHADYRFGDFKTNMEHAGITELVHHPLISAELAGVLARSVASSAARRRVRRAAVAR